MLAVWNNPGALKVKAQIKMERPEAFSHKELSMVLTAPCQNLLGLQEI